MSNQDHHMQIYTQRGLSYMTMNPWLWELRWEHEAQQALGFQEWTNAFDSFPKALQRAKLLFWKWSLKLQRERDDIGAADIQWEMTLALLVYRIVVSLRRILVQSLVRIQDQLELIKQPWVSRLKERRVGDQIFDQYFEFKSEIHHHL